MRRFAVRVAFGLIFTLSASSMAAAQVVPGTIQSSRDPLLKRGFRDVSFTRPVAAPGPVLNWPLPQHRALDTLGAPLPGVTAAPEPHGTTIPCVMRTVPVDPRHKSSMPVVGVDKRGDPKSVVTIPTCQPRD